MSRKKAPLRHRLAIRVVVFFPEHLDRNDPLDQSLSWGTE
jgi:hypothetical protein